MSAFDRRVLQWLDNSTIPDKAKITMLNRVNAGIQGYRTTPLDAAGTPQALQVDFALTDAISKAIRKLEGGGEHPNGSLFPNLAKKSSTAANGDKPGSAQGGAKAQSNGNQRPQQRSSSRSLTHKSSSARSGQASGTEQKPKEGQPAKDGQQLKKKESKADMGKDSANGSPTKPSPTFANFSFGESAHPSAAEQKEQPVDDNDDELADAEDRRRRRLTLAKRASRHAVSAEVFRKEEQDEFDMPVVPKPTDITRRILKTLEKHHLFAHLDDKDLHHIAGIMTIKTFKKGEKLLTQGKECDVFSIVVTGSCASKTRPLKINIGQCINEVGLMYDNKSDDTIEAAMAMTQVCQLPRRAYQIICAKASQAKRARYEDFLSRVKFLSGLEPSERLQLADALKEATYKKGDYLIRFGEPGEWFSIILEGVVKVVGRGEKGEPIDVCTFSEGDCVGELEFLFKHRTVADVVAETDLVKTAKMTTYHFEKVIGSAKEVLERKAHDDAVYGYYRQKKDEMDSKRKSIDQ